MALEQKSLPANPNLTQIKNQAEELQRSVQAGDKTATGRVVAFHPAIESASDITGEFALNDPQLNTAVGARMVEERDLHRWFGVQLNNGMWDAIEDEAFGPESPVIERERMLYSAYASAYHWRNVGSEVNYARGEHLISRMAIKVGEAEITLRHARRAFKLIERHHDAMEDWDEPFAHEAMARAYAALGT